MALPTTAIWEVRTDGSDTNGGGFKQGGTGTDWTQQAAAQYSVTDAVTNGTTTITSATASFGTDVVDNFLYIQGGTGSVAANWYHITARASATSITVDRSTGLTAGTGATLKIGGALASIGGAKAAGLTTGHICYVKNGTYTISTATVNVSGGTISDTVQFTICGYGTNRSLTNTDTRPVLQYAASTITMVSNRGLIINIEFDGNSQTSPKVDVGSGAVFYRCLYRGMGVNSGSGIHIYCIATGNSAATLVGHVSYSEAYSNTATPISSAQAIHTISYNNTGASTDGFDVSGASTNAYHCHSYGNGRHGFNFAATRGGGVSNCHAENNGGYGFNLTNNSLALVECSAYNNTSGTFPTLLQTVLNLGFITVTDGSVYTNAAGSDFSLNATALRGALLRAAGFPTTSPTGSSPNYIDIGAYQHQDSGGGGTTFIYNLME